MTALLFLPGCYGWYTIKEIPDTERLKVRPGESQVRVWGPVQGVANPDSDDQPTLEGTVKAYSYPVLVVMPNNSEEEDPRPVTVILLESGNVEAEVKATDPGATAASVTVGAVLGGLLLLYIAIVSSGGFSWGGSD